MTEELSIPALSYSIKRDKHQTNYLFLRGFWYQPRHMFAGYDTMTKFFLSYSKAVAGTSHNQSINPVNWVTNTRICGLAYGVLNNGQTFRNPLKAARSLRDYKGLDLNENEVAALGEMINWNNQSFYSLYEDSFNRKSLYRLYKFAFNLGVRDSQEFDVSKKFLLAELGNIIENMDLEPIKEPVNGTKSNRDRDMMFG